MVVRLLMPHVDLLIGTQEQWTLPVAIAANYDPSGCGISRFQTSR